MNSIKHLIAITICLSLTACATLLGSKYETVPIVSNPSGAIAKVTNEQGEVVFNGITPTKVFLQKSNGGYLTGSNYKVELSKTGYQTITNSLHTKINWIYLLNPISAISVDASNGTLYNFDKEAIHADWQIIEAAEKEHLALKQIYSQFKSPLEKDVADNIVLMKNIAQQGEATALYELGNLYSNREDITTNQQTAYNYYLQAAEKGFSPAQHQIGVIKFTQQDYDAALKWFLLADKQHYLPSSIYLSKMYLKDLSSTDSNYYMSAKSLIALLTYTAEQGNLDSLYKLGLLYYEGKYAEKDINKAIDILEELADDNHAKSLHQLGLIELEEKEYEDALELFIQARKNKHAESNYYIGKIYAEQLSDEKNSYTLALEALQKALKTQINQQQIADTNYLLGIMYLNGYGVKKDIDISNKHLQKATQLEHHKAPFYLAQNLIQDNIITDKIAALYQKSAEHGFKKAMNFIAEMYNKGRYFKQDTQKSIYWYKKSIEQNDNEARLALAQIYLKQQSLDEKQSAELATLIKILSKQTEDQRIQYELALLYKEGKYLKQDLDKAIDILEAVADDNYPAAKYTLGTIAFQQKEYKDALEWFLSAKTHNHNESNFYIGKIYFEGLADETVNHQLAFTALSGALEAKLSTEQLAETNYLLGIMHLNGYATAKNIQLSNQYLSEATRLSHAKAPYYLANNLLEQNNIPEALVLYKKSAEYGFVKAQNIMGELFYEGKYLPKDLTQAIYYYEQAASKGDVSAKDKLGQINIATSQAEQDKKTKISQQVRDTSGQQQGSK